jgi:pimeloyl-ACP methyl ester carboxylesterase
MTDLPVRRFRCLDGVELAWREIGSGRPFVLLHGLLGSGARLAGQGLVTGLAERGYRVILPDLRGHGDSGRPHNPARYPADILADDMLALIGHMGLDDYDLGGYSMGGKLVLRLLARGARPAHAVVGGQGLDALDAESDRTDGHRRILAAVAGGAAFPAGSHEDAMADWIRQSGVDARAVGLVLDTFMSTPADALRAVSVPTLIIVGDRDSRGTSADALAALLANGAAHPGARRPRHRPRRPGVHDGGCRVCRDIPAGKLLRFPSVTSTYRPGQRLTTAPTAVMLSPFAINPRAAARPGGAHGRRARRRGGW